MAHIWDLKRMEIKAIVSLTVVTQRGSDMMIYDSTIQLSHNYIKVFATMSNLESYI